MTQKLQSSVLCALDLAGSTGSALKWSLEMARQMNARLTILYTYRLLQSAGNGVAVKESREREAKAQFQKLEREFLHETKVPYSFTIEIGFVADRVADFAKKNRLSLLVIDKNTCADNQESFDDLMTTLKVPALIVP